MRLLIPQSTVLLGGLNEIINMSLSAHCVAHNKHRVSSDLVIIETPCQKEEGLIL